MECFLKLIIWSAKKWVQAILWATNNFWIFRFRLNGCWFTVLALFPLFSKWHDHNPNITQKGQVNINFRTLEKVLLLLVFSEGQTSFSSNYVLQPISHKCQFSGSKWALSKWNTGYQNILQRVKMHCKGTFSWKLFIYICSYGVISLLKFFFFLPWIIVKNFGNCCHRLSW